MPTERCRYLRVAHLETGRKIVEEDIEIHQYHILLNVHMFPGRAPLHLLWRNFAVLFALAIKQGCDLGSILRQ